MRKNALQLGLAAVLAGCVQGAPSAPQDVNLPTDWPTTCQQAIDRIVAEMPESDKAELRKDSLSDLPKYHLGWGMGIRNEYGLWRGNDALARDCARRFGDPSDSRSLHPDAISSIIIEQVWRAVR